MLAVDEVTVAGRRLGWRAILLDATRATVERDLHQKLEVHRAEVTLVCGEFETKTTINGHQVDIQWSASDPDATVDSITVILSEHEASLNAITLSARLTNRFPGLCPREGQIQKAGFASLCLVENPDLVILINAAERYIFISSKGCID